MSLTHFLLFIQQQASVELVAPKDYAESSSSKVQESSTPTVSSLLKGERLKEILTLRRESYVNNARAANAGGRHIKTLVKCKHVFSKYRLRFLYNAIC